MVKDAHSGKRRRPPRAPSICITSGLVLAVGFAPAVTIASEPSLDPVDGRLDAQVQAILSSTGAPSASIAVVAGGKPVWVRAYGSARLGPSAPARPSTRYGVGSISKQFTAAALLILQSQGRLSLDDRVSRWFPDLTSADAITVRQVLTHTAGYRDFYPDDYTPTFMRTRTTPDQIMTGWAKQPLDFQPGSDWQYSNTGYVIAGRIVERVSGQSLFSFLKANIFDPLGMREVVDNDAQRIGPPDAVGYARAALGPVRPVVAEGSGWMFGAGELAMPASDLALWDASLLKRSLMSSDAYRQEASTAILTSGADTHYALGFFVRQSAGGAVYEHSGEIAGFVSENRIYPDKDTAIVVLTNLEATSAARLIADRVSELVLTPDPVDASVRQMFLGLQKGVLDRTRLTPDLNDYFTALTIGDFATSLGPLGTPSRFARVSTSRRGGMEFRSYRAAFSERTLDVSVYISPNGDFEQFLVSPAD